MSPGRGATHGTHGYCAAPVFFEGNRVDQVPYRAITNSMNAFSACAEIGEVSGMRIRQHGSHGVLGLLLSAAG